jgi:hypothetical protein
MEQPVPVQGWIYVTLPQATTGAAGKPGRRTAPPQAAIFSLGKAGQAGARRAFPPGHTSM